MNAWTFSAVREVIRCLICGRAVVFAYDPEHDRAKLVELGSDKEHDVTKCAQNRAN